MIDRMVLFQSVLLEMQVCSIYIRRKDCFFSQQLFRYIEHWSFRQSCSTLIDRLIWKHLVSYWWTLRKFDYTWSIKSLPCFRYWISDSLAFDFYKWLHSLHDADCVLIHGVQLFESTFATHNVYIHSNERGYLIGKLWFNDLVPELSRSFRASEV